MERTYSDTRQGAIKLLNDQDQCVAEFILRYLKFPPRKMQRWSCSKALARREFCEIVGLSKIAQSKKLKDLFERLGHRQLVHFIVIWRFENNVLDHKSWGDMFGTTGQSTNTWMLKAQRRHEEAVKLAAACFGFHNAVEMGAVKWGNPSQINENGSIDCFYYVDPV